MSSGTRQPLLVIAGPTGSGKSGLALALAQRLRGVIVNADALQLYRDLRLLTARPSASDEARVPHRLYGILGPDESSAAGWWRGQAVAAIDEAWAAERLPILVGGTGLYLKALLEGLSPMPAIPDAVRQAARALAERIGGPALHAELARRDPLMAARLRPSDRQRVTRAWEVIEATGRSLALWQAEKGQPFAARTHAILLMPERTALRASLDVRFLAMVEGGGQDEARSLIASPADWPIRRALGLNELISYLKGEISYPQAIAQAQAATRAYAKRQATWFRHQFRADQTQDAQFSERLLEEILPKIRQFLLTEPG
ncbi:MAG: tRNA (adenosine(37)-N6)-dimethylallyltransferase MiaA [Rhodospirillales bacterium]|nr:tRNA (adenosine(37)-N6)-dimethylallyltransferase MiaA [Rhodospirillales bacterium]